MKQAVGRERIYRFWDELADFDAARSDEAMCHLMRGLCKLAGGWNASWVWM